MHKIIPDGKSGDFGIKKQVITKEDIKLANLRAIFHPQDITPKLGTVTILYRKSDMSWETHKVVMSDSEFDKYTNSNIIRIAFGHVLIGGLGLGMIILPMLKNENIKKITVVEKEQDIINLIYEHIKHFDTDDKLEVISDDIFKIEFPKTLKFDTMYFDIWNNVCGDNYEQMKILKKRFKKNRAKNANVSCWEEDKTRWL